MEFEVSYSLENEQQFWDELDEIVSAHCQTPDSIDNALRAYLKFTTNYKEEYLQTEQDVARCSYKLLDSALFKAHLEYVRRQIVYCLLQEDDAPTLHVIAAFLLFDGRNNEATFELMKSEGAFPRLVELIQSRRDDDLGLHRILLELLYEMSRIQRLLWEDLVTIDDAFILYLFQIIEHLSGDVNDPYHYPVIRVLLVLNEQYMVATHDPAITHKHRITNRVIKALSTHGAIYKVFGENIILLLNRESETSSQLLILKLLYLMFTTPPTYEYFYTNDLHVLVDVIIRNLLDLPQEASALRHTYLRVLYPVLAHSQLKYPPHYKKRELKKLLTALARESDSESTQSWRHFEPADPTTVRLVSRCISVEWLKEPVDSSTASASSTPKEGRTSSTMSDQAVAKKLLGMSLEEGKKSSLSVAEVATHMEKPGIITPSVSKTGANGKTAGYVDDEEGVVESPIQLMVEDTGQGPGRSPFADD